MGWPSWSARAGSGIAPVTNGWIWSSTDFSGPNEADRDQQLSLALVLQLMRTGHRSLLPPDNMNEGQLLSANRESSYG